MFEGSWEVDRTGVVFAAAADCCWRYEAQADSGEPGEERLGFLIDESACGQDIWVEFLIWLVRIPKEEYVVDDQSNFWWYGIDEGTCSELHRDCRRGVLEALHAWVGSDESKSVSPRVALLG